ncbi:MAG: hypothetical protein WCD79_08250, partial [Chthoniobacteraceae bacterium]
FPVWVHIHGEQGVAFAIFFPGGGFARFFTWFSERGEEGSRRGAEGAERGQALVISDQWNGEEHRTSNIEQCLSGLLTTQEIACLLTRDIKMSFIQHQVSRIQHLRFCQQTG